VCGGSILVLALLSGGQQTLQGHFWVEIGLLKSKLENVEITPGTRLYPANQLVASCVLLRRMFQVPNSTLDAPLPHDWPPVPGCSLCLDCDRRWDIYRRLAGIHYQSALLLGCSTTVR
jgi:hypothetical protein